MKLSIIFPAYNEEKRIIPTLESYYNFYNKKLKRNFEMIIIPNNCKDNTLKITKDIAKNKEQVRVFNIPEYSGKGGAVIKGFELANGEFIGFTDADNSITPKNFYKLYENKENYDGIIASRKIKGATIFPKRRFSQNLSSFLFHVSTRILFGFKYYDTQCGAKLFTKKTAKFLMENGQEIGWAFDVDLLYLCKKNKLKILEYPINWVDSAGSKLTFWGGIESFLRLIKLRIKS